MNKKTVGVYTREGGMVERPNEQLEARVFDSPAVRDNVIVYNLLTCYRRGDCTLHEATLWMVLHLAEQNKSLLEQCVKLSAVQPATYLLTREGLAAVDAAPPEGG
jgi:hypothetical protein